MSVEIYLIFPYIGKVVRLYIYNTVLMINPETPQEMFEVVSL